jgi:hypothetical protein
MPKSKNSTKKPMTRSTKKALTSSILTPSISTPLIPTPSISTLPIPTLSLSTSSIQTPPSQSKKNLLNKIDLSQSHNNDECIEIEDEGSKACKYSLYIYYLQIKE